jgi:DNA polymerase/3'-5' exonuclease PolX
MSKKNLKIQYLTALNPKNQIFINELTSLVNMIQIENSIASDKSLIQTNNFKIASFKKCIGSIAKFKVQITNSSQLVGISGFGKGIIERINQILIKGYLSEVKELETLYKHLENKNKIINELVEVIGIGKANATELVYKYGITSLENLKVRVKSKTIEVNDKIKLGLKYAGKFETKIPRKITTRIYDLISDVARMNNPNLIITICGSYRRGLPQSSDIDVLICDTDILFKEDMINSNVLKKFIYSLKKEKLITDDLTSDQVLSKYMGFCKYNNKNYRIDIRLVPLESYFSALVYFTGSYQLNTMMRSSAKKLGYKLNEYGLFKINTSKSELTSADGEQFDISSEDQLFKILGMEYLEPEQRNFL